MQENNLNQFWNLIKNFTNLENYTNFLSEVKFVDITETTNKGVKILIHSNEMVNATFQSIIRKNVDSIGEYGIKTAKSLQNALDSKNPKELIELNQESLQSYFENCATTSKEFIDSTYNASNKVLEAIMNIGNDYINCFTNSMKNNN